MYQSLSQSFPYVVALLWAFILLVLVLESRRRQQTIEQRWNKRQMLLQSELGRLRSTVADLQTRLQDAEVRAELDIPVSTAISALNVNRRTQAIRLLRRGERPEQVSAALGIPSPETELLLKVHRIVTARNEEAC